MESEGSTGHRCCICKQEPNVHARACMRRAAVFKCSDVLRDKTNIKKTSFGAPVISQEIILLLPLWLKRPSISMEDLEWAMQSMEQGTMPSWAGERSVVRTKHQSGLSCSRSKTSTVWPRRTVSSPLLPPLLATKSCMTTVSSQPPESWKGNKGTLNVFSRG